MEFGLTWAKLDEMEYVTEAENLGFTHLWVTDSGLIRSDAFVFLSVAAQQTKTMKLGMGVAVPGLRLAPTLAAGMATLKYGPAIMTAMHSTMDRHLEYGEDPPEFLRPIWKDYLEFHMSRPVTERQKVMHESHNAYVSPDERRFVTPAAIKRFCIVGQPAEVLEQVRELERKGVRQLMCNFPLERGYQMARDYAKNIIRKL